MFFFSYNNNIFFFILIFTENQQLRDVISMLTSTLVLILINQAILVRNSPAPNNGFAAPSDVSRKQYGGCLCKQYINYATCFSPQHCKRFPREFKTELRTFKLATTGIENITVGNFDNLADLNSLLIEANSALTRFESGSFANLTRLKNLTIADNSNLNRLEEDTFAGLVSLEYLSITRNAFDGIRSFSSALKSESMPNLKKLELNELHCPIIERDDFGGLNGSNLEELDLTHSQIEYIHAESLSHLKGLKVLSLGENQINTTTLIDLLLELIKNNITLDTLNLHQWGFKRTLPKDLMEIVAQSQVKELILSSNQFDVIDDDSFPPMPHLQVFILTDVLLSNFTIDAKISLPNLQSLCIAKNKLSSISGKLLPHTLNHLDVSQQLGAFKLSNGTFENLVALEYLDLSSNNIRILNDGILQGLTRLEYLNLRNSTIHYIDARSFRDLGKLKSLNLERNKPNSLAEDSVFEGLYELEELNLGHCNLNSLRPILFEPLRSLRKLDLGGNNLKMIEPVLFHPLQRLENLNLEQNELWEWNQRLFETNTELKVLNLYDNKLHYFTKAILDDIINLEYLNFTGNSFICTCEDFKAFSYYNSTMIDHIWKVLSNISDSDCLYPHGKHNLINYFRSVYLEDGCRITPIDYILPISVVLTLILIFMVTVYRYRWHIRYWIFLTRMFLSKRAQFHRNINLQGHDNYLYDAFVSYSSEDRNFVVRLVAMLENYEPFLKLCVYERDFEIGAFISENVLECVARSRKTLLIISNSYIKSQWCRWEAQVAENHRLFFQNERGECVNDSIIMIKLGNVSQDHLSPMLRYLMKTRIYLQWDQDEAKQRSFWEKLRNALAPPIGPLETKKTDLIVKSDDAVKD